jgi:hypothetical protein
MINLTCYVDLSIFTSSYQIQYVINHSHLTCGDADTTFVSLLHIKYHVEMYYELNV